MRAGAHVVGLLAALLATAAGAREAPIPAQYDDASFVAGSLLDAPELALGGARVTGITVPHHLLAADLIAAAFRAAAASARPDRIVVLTPDHFKRSARPFATTRASFETALGPVPTDLRAVDRLLASPDVAASWLFKREHGIGVLLPYLRRFFPGVPVVPVAVAIGSRRAAWDAMVRRLKPLVGARTLIVQSTDFSHYLSVEDATRHDRQSLAALASGDLDAVAALRQPQHLDALGAQYIQSRLQHEAFGAETIVFAHRNSARYSAPGPDGTTSYIAQVHVTGAVGRVLVPDPALRERTVCFAGDTYFGRYVAMLLARPQAAGRVRASLAARLGGCPLVVNLEGVTVAAAPAPPLGASAPAGPLAMERETTFAWLRELGVRAVGVANNHSHDFGAAPFAAMVGDLRSAGWTVLEPGRLEPVGPVDVIAWTDLDNETSVRTGLIGDDAFAAVAAPTPGRPRVAFMHWGREFEAEPGDRERMLAGRLERAGIDLVVGAHPHRASTAIERLGGSGALLAYSLGNFMFDQRGPAVSQALVQVTVFETGAIFVRRVALPSVHALASASPPNEEPASSGRAAAR